MNRSVFENEGPRLWPVIRRWWSEITEADLERVGGKFDQFTNLLQVKYGYSLKRGEEEFNRRMALLRANRAQHGEAGFRAIWQSANPAHKS